MKHVTNAQSATVAGPITAVLLTTALGLAACGGSAAPSPSSTASPSATSAAAVDPCLVGTWTTVAQNQNSPANDEQITYTGGAGEVFTIAANGELTIDTHAAHKVVFKDSAGGTFSATVSGTGRGTIATSTSGTTRIFDFKPSADDTRKTLSLDSTGTELGPARPDTPFSAYYTCAPGRFTFYKRFVNYMIDGPIVTLKSGSGTSSSTGSLSPS
jgi:hypothetical protein